MVSITLDADVSDEVLTSAARTFGRSGMTVSEAVGLFLKNAAGGGYVSVDSWAPNSETIAAMHEAELGLDEEVSLERLLSQFDEGHKTVDGI